MAKYTPENVKPVFNSREDLFRWMRSCPQRLCGPRGPTLVGLIEQSVSEALTLGCPHVEALFHEDWAVIGGRRDWFAVPSRVPVTEEALFERLFAFPEAGDNSIRSEAVVAAFCRDVVTSAAEQVRIVQGVVPATDPIVAFLRERRWARAVAFRHLRSDSTE